jgi:hypothetical protein
VKRALEIGGEKKERENFAKHKEDLGRGEERRGERRFNLS